MKLELANKEVMVGGVSETGSFRIEMNAMAFHSVIDGIYADKIRSPFRELCTNARDGHAANGNLDEPFDVFLPSTLSPVFKVRDYGTGLSHDDVMGLYTTMFASSKRDSNQAVGMIGLGSKSPFAYTSAFTVVSWFDGVETVYSAFIGDSGIPQIAVMAKKPSTERNGMEISMPVQQKDIKTFRDAAAGVLFGFDPFPRILNETWTRTMPEKLHEGTGWVFYKKDATNRNLFPFNTMMARQGCVLYPINAIALNIQVPTNSYTTNANSIYRWPIVIDFPIGSLDVATSRESLGYTAKTIASIKAGVDRFRSEMANVLEQQIAAATSYLDACFVYDKSLDDPSGRELWNVFGSGVTYKGRGLVRDFVSHTKSEGLLENDGYEATQINTSVFTLGTNNPNLAFRTYKYRQNLSIRASALKNAQFWVEDPDCTFGPSRMRRVLLEAKQGPIIWIRPRSRIGLGRFLIGLEKPTLHYLADVERLPVDDTVKAARVKAKEEVWFSYIIANKTFQYNMGQESRVPTADMICIRQVAKEYFLDDVKPVVWNDMAARITEAVHAGIIPEGTRVYFLNSRHEKLRETIKFKTFKQYFLEQFHANGGILMKDAALTLNAPTRTAKVGKAKKIVEYLATTRAPRDLTTYMRDVAQKEVTPPTSGNRLTAIANKIIPEEIKEAIKVEDSYYEQFDALKVKYPLLEASISSPETFGHYMELLLK